MRRKVLGTIVLATLFFAPGCGWVVETQYGRSRGESINGTGVLAELFREGGHTVRVARALTDEVGETAQTILRVAPQPGPIDELEADWYLNWQESGPDRRLIYVCRDYDAEPEYWEAVLRALPDSTKASRRESIESALAASRKWAADLPPKSDEPADPMDWFSINDSSNEITSSQALDGPWAAGIDAMAAAVPRRQVLQVRGENVLLRGDGRALAIEWSWGESAEPGRVLVLANGGFLLNGAMLTSGRRPLLSRVVRWAGPAPRSIVFVEGEHLFVDADGPPSLVELIRRLPTLAWIGLHFIVLALAGVLARALAIGRVAPPPPSGSDRPRAHAEALGALLSRSGDARLARDQLEAYRRWRFPLSRSDG